MAPATEGTFPVIIWQQSSVVDQDVDDCFVDNLSTTLCYIGAISQDQAVEPLTSKGVGGGNDLLSAVVGMEIDLDAAIGNELSMTRSDRTTQTAVAPPSSFPNQPIATDLSSSSSSSSSSGTTLHNQSATSTTSSSTSTVSSSQNTTQQQQQQQQRRQQSPPPPTYGPDDYAKVFDPQLYLSEFYASADGQNGPGSPLAFVLRALNYIRAKLQLELSNSVTERTLVDVGCGPTVHSVMSLSDLYDAIYLCDPNASCREELTNFWRQPARAFNWRPTLQAVARLESGFSVLPGCSSAVEITADEIEHRIRRSIHGVLHCDLLNDNYKVIADLPCETVDCVVSSLTLEAVCSKVKDYNKALRQLANLLSTEGHLILIGILDTDSYLINGQQQQQQQWRLLRIDEMDLRCALRYAGLNVKCWFRQRADTGETVELDFSQFTCDEDDADAVKLYEDMFVLVAHK